MPIYKQLRFLCVLRQTGNCLNFHIIQPSPRKHTANTNDHNRVRLPSVRIRLISLGPLTVPEPSNQLLIHDLEVTPVECKPAARHNETPGWVKSNSPACTLTPYIVTLNDCRSFDGVAHQLGLGLLTLLSADFAHRHR